LLAIPVSKPRLFLADKGYDGDFLREELLIQGIRPVIPPKANRKNPPACDFQVYKDRNRIERMFNRLKQFRRIATRYDKTRNSFSAFLALAASQNMAAILCQQDLVLKLARLRLCSWEQSNSILVGQVKNRRNLNF
jgi:transposase